MFLFYRSIALILALAVSQTVTAETPENVAYSPIPAVDCVINPYRVVDIAVGDLGAPAVRKFDCEAWIPSQERYRELTSASNTTDYQARRMKLRFKDENKKNRMCHTLNGSGTALPRLYVALIETFQQADGNIRLPETLQPYFGSDSIG